MTLRERLEQTARRALEAFGHDAQRLQAQEECAELIVALSHARRGRRNIDVAGEIADVLIMVEQMRIAFGPETVDAKIAKKLTRLEAAIAEHGLWVRE